MRWRWHNSEEPSRQTAGGASVKPCAAIQAEFSAYLDGAVSGVEMGLISSHLRQCPHCDREFQVWRELQQSLGSLRPEPPPARFQAWLRTALAEERRRGAHLPLLARALYRWRRSMAPLALRLAGGLAATLLLTAGLSWVFAVPSTVQANDDAMAHLVPPHFLYSATPPEPITTRADVPIVVEAMVDNRGRVYSYRILEGPDDPEVNLRVENNLLSSVFRPATVFGIPVRGHVVMTYSGVFVKG
jgi:hypothetical protein